MISFEKKNNLYKMLMVIIVTSIITFILTAGGMYAYYFKINGVNDSKLSAENGKMDSYADLILKMQVLKKYLNKHYIGDLEENKMLESALKGYVEGVGDVYTEYLTEEEFKEFLTDVNGDYVGVGIYMAEDIEGNIIVLMPIEGSPAEQVGIKTGDIITKVNGEECKGQELEIIANKIKGEAGTKVNLEILREDNTIEIEVERKKVDMKYIQSKMLENNIGYIKMLSFSEDASDKFEQELNGLLEKNIKSLIIDLRNNGGGVVEEVLKIADLFTDKDDILMIERGKENENKTITSKKQTNLNLNVVVLTNENSASASEILAAALKDNNIAKIVGQKTYGKGVMQEVIEIASGGAIKVTIEEFLTPKGDQINKIGISPDVEVELDEDSETDTQLKEAIELLK